jgi:hypothetical protein
LQTPVNSAAAPLPSQHQESDFATPALTRGVGPDYGNEVEYLPAFIDQLRKEIEPDLSYPKYLRRDVP